MCLILGIMIVTLSLLPIVNAATPLASTSMFMIYALNANGLVQPVKLNHINKVIDSSILSNLMPSSLGKPKHNLS